MSAHLTPEVVAVIKATAPVVAENATKITSTFYKTMFANNPEVLAFFNKSHQDGGKQPQALANSVVQYALNIENLGALVPLVTQIAHRHVALSIKPEHYGIVHKNLMIAIGKVLGSAVTPEIANAWSEAVLALAEICIGVEEKVYQANEKRAGGWRYEREFEVRKKEKLADKAVLLEFAPVDGYEGPFEFTAGQYLTLRIPELVAAPRHYTITSAPGESSFQIIVRHVQGGVMSTYIHKSLNVGDVVKLGAPMGLFTPTTKDMGLVLISAGVGLTPMKACLEAFGAKRCKAVLHVEKNAKRHACAKQFKAAVPDCTFVYTESEGGHASVQTKLDALFARHGNKVEYMVCGPLHFMDQVVAQLNKLGAKNVHYEVFGTGNLETNKSAEKAAMVCPFSGKEGNAPCPAAAAAAAAARPASPPANAAASGRRSPAPVSASII